MMIEHEGKYKVIEASNGAEAVEQALSHHIDLILMDVRMPVMNGIEAIRHIRAQKKTQKWLSSQHLLIKNMHLNHLSKEQSVIC